MNHLLWVPQLSCYTPDGKFNLVGDSNWQLVVTKLPYMLDASQDLVVDVIVPWSDKCAISPIDLLEDALTPKQIKRVKLINVSIAANAPRTRYDFDWGDYKNVLSCNANAYTHVYVNDPMLFRHLKALFYVEWKSSPKFIVQTHFLDTPADPIVPSEISYWHGTVEANIRADVCMWHCDAMQSQFAAAMNNDYAAHLVSDVIKKSVVWKSGYSINEIRKPIDFNNIRFNHAALDHKTVIWVPNRIGGLGKSLDYTNNGKFMFETIPELWKHRKDFIVLAGNPSGKISNDEIATLCPAYVKLLDGPLNRDEYRWLSARANIVVGLYVTDTNGGLASLESIEFNAFPLFPDVNEYKTYFDKVNWPQTLRVKNDLSDLVEVTSRLIDVAQLKDIGSSNEKSVNLVALRNFIRQYAAYEHTTQNVMKRLGI